MTNLLIIPHLIEKDSIHKILLIISVILLFIPVLSTPLLVVDSQFYTELFSNRTTNPRLFGIDLNYRFNSVLTNSRTLGTYLLIGLISLLSLHNKRKNFYFYSLISSLLLGIVLSGSRGPVLSIFAVSIVYILYEYSEPIYVQIIFLIMGLFSIISVIIAAYLIDIGYNWLIFDIRVVHWYASLRAISDNILLGYEFGKWDGSHIMPYYLEGYPVLNPHNSVLLVGLYLGAFGMISYALIKFYAFTAYISSTNTNIHILLIGIVLTIHQLTSGDFPLGYSPITLLSTIVIGLIIKEIC